MRRSLLAAAGLAALSCAGAQKPPAAAAPTTVQPGEAARVVPRGFEPQPNEIVTEYDLTHDGKPDVWKYTVKDATGKEILVRKEKDLNGDGKIDTWEKYAPDGSLVKVVYDLDFDGKPDEILHFEKDQLVKKEMAFGFDGIPRSWSYYEKGKLVRKERDTNGDGKVDYWEYWENGEIDRIGIDTDGDGQVDRWEARKSAEASSDAPAPAPQK
ncbi:MAG TPA: hypothetical protein VFK90_12965 [Anaeromyxobacter sp.]|nr:hypothetical protein [Anaeromyxobacter sp.]